MVLNDIELKSGKWLGYSLKEGKLIVKTGSTSSISSGNETARSTQSI